MRRRSLAYATEKTYLYWIRLFIRFQKRRHPREMGAAEVDTFPSWLAVEKYSARDSGGGAECARVSVAEISWYRFRAE